MLKVTNHLCKYKRTNNNFSLNLRKGLKLNLNSLNLFYEHFKAIATTQDADDDESGNKGLDFNCIIEELHVD